METRRQAHCVYRCEYHIVWIPRYRNKILVNNIADYLSHKLDEVRKHYPEIEIIERNIRPDHVHLLVSFPPKHSVARVVQILKQNTAKALKDKYDFMQNRYWDKQGIWSVGYFVSTVGLNEEMITNYIKYQAKEDSGQAKLELG